MPRSEARVEAERQVAQGGQARERGHARGPDLLAPVEPHGAEPLEPLEVAEPVVARCLPERRDEVVVDAAGDVRAVFPPVADEHAPGHAHRGCHPARLLSSCGGWT